MIKSQTSLIGLEMFIKRLNDRFTSADVIETEHLLKSDCYQKVSITSTF